jgi:hypothetical protein
MTMRPSDNNHGKVGGPDQNTTPQFSWNHVKITSILAASSLILLVLLSFFKFMLSIEASPSPHRERAFWLIPIFLAHNTADGKVTHINENDLGIKAEDLSEKLVKLPWSDIKIEPNLSGVVTLSQPDEFTSRKALLRNLNLNPIVIEQAITDNQDFTRLNQQHKKAIFTLPNGEKAVWIQVRQTSRMGRSWNGILYVIRGGIPVLLINTNAQTGFIIKDIDEDGFKDVVRATANTATTIHWEYFKWTPEVNSFRQHFKTSDRFVYQFILKEAKVFMFAIAPFVFVFLVGMKFRIAWMKWIVRLYFYFNLLFILSFTLLNIINIVLGCLIILFQYCCTWMAFKRFKRKKSSEPKTADSS